MRERTGGTQHHYSPGKRAPRGGGDGRGAGAMAKSCSTGIALVELVIAVELLDAARTRIADVALSEALQPLPSIFTNAGVAADGLELLDLCCAPDDVVGHIHNWILGNTLPLVKLFVMGRT